MAVAVAVIVAGGVAVAVVVVVSVSVSVSLAVSEPVVLPNKCAFQTRIAKPSLEDSVSS